MIREKTVKRKKMASIILSSGSGLRNFYLLSTRLFRSLLISGQEKTIKGVWAIRDA